MITSIGSGAVKRITSRPTTRTRIFCDVAFELPSTARRTDLAVGAGRRVSESCIEEFADRVEWRADKW